MLSRVVYTSTCLYLSIRLVFNVYRPTVFSESRACSATLCAVSRWKRACSRTENYGEQCKAEGFLKILLGVFIVFVKAHLDILSLHFPDEPYYRPLYLPLKRGGQVCSNLEGPRRVLLRYCKTLSISFSASKQTASPL